MELLLEFLGACWLEEEEEGPGHRAMAGRGEEQAWAPWEEGSRAPCALGKKALLRVGEETREKNVAATE